MPDLHKIWQLRQCGVPSIVTRHSKQTPMPQSGPRGWPVTDVRQQAPASAIATATVEPAGAAIERPFTRSVIGSGTERVHLARGQIRFAGNFGLLTHDLIRQQARRSQRHRDA